MKGREVEVERQKRYDPHIVEQMIEKCHSNKYESTLQECLKVFIEIVQEGVIYVYTCCPKTLFRWSAHNIENINVTMVDKCNNWAKCKVDIIAKDSKEWICKICHSAICDARVSKLLIYNKMVILKQPPELNLYPMEESLVALKTPFMQIWDWPCGGQNLVHWNIVNVPVDIVPTINVLPRSTSNADTVAIKFREKRHINNVNYWKIYNQWMSGKLYIVLYTIVICIKMAR